MGRIGEGGGWGGPPMRFKLFWGGIHFSGPLHGNSTYISVSSAQAQSIGTLYEQVG
jgi:hypothetical protein